MTNEQAQEFFDKLEKIQLQRVKRNQKCRNYRGITSCYNCSFFNNCKKQKDYNATSETQKKLLENYNIDALNVRH